MNKRIRTLIFGDACECRAAAQMLQDTPLLSELQHESCHLDDLEELEQHLAQWQPTLVVVLANGAKGMECVYRSRERRPNLPVFWFSDDQAFGVQSYRLECAYFSTKPVSTEKLHRAILRCQHMGIPYGTA